MIVFGKEEKEAAIEPYRAMCRALAEAFGARVAELSAEVSVGATHGVPSRRSAGNAGGSSAGSTSEAMPIAQGASASRTRTPSGAALPFDGVVHVVAYQHRFGVDFSVHASLESAYRATMETVRRQCLRDEAIRTRVESHFGHWAIERMSYDEQDELVTGWERFAEGEAIWISTCDIEGASRGQPTAGEDPVPDPAIVANAALEVDARGRGSGSTASSRLANPPEMEARSVDSGTRWPIVGVQSPFACESRRDMKSLHPSIERSERSGTPITGRGRRGRRLGGSGT